MVSYFDQSTQTVHLIIPCNEVELHLKTIELFHEIQINKWNKCCKYFWLSSAL